MAAESNRVLIAGGGIAAIEAMLAVRDLTEGTAQITLVSPEREFTYRPLLVTEPFEEVAERRDLPAIADELGAELVEAALERIDPEAHVAELSDGSRFDYAAALIAIGARMRPAFEGVHTLWVEYQPRTVDSILDDAAEQGGLCLIAPPGVTWTLPLYEFALMAQRRRGERGEDTPITIVTPEESPLNVFGAVPSSEVRELLGARGIEVVTGTWVSQKDDGTLAAGQGRLEIRGLAVALPVIEGRSVEGVPTDEAGFIPIDHHGRVRGLTDVYAAGDGADFPVKQGGIATQQADAAAECIAASLGHPVEPEPYRPVLRGRLLTGGETISMRADIGGGGGEGVVDDDYLWWPPHKVSGRYLAPFLAGETAREEAEPPRRSIDVEVSLPHEWHGKIPLPSVYRGDTA